MSQQASSSSSTGGFGGAQASKIAEEFTRLLIGNMPSRNPNESNEEGHTGTLIAGTSTAKLRNAEEIGFFDPGHETESTTGIVTNGKHAMYTDVFIFTDRLQYMVKLHGEQPVRNLWSTCLRGTALAWHAVELTEMEQDLLNNTSMALFCSVLNKRLRMAPAETLKSMNTSTFTLADLRNRKSIRIYTQEIFRAARSVAGESIYQQLLAIYNVLAPQIKIHITLPTETTTMRNFFEEVDAQSTALLELAQTQAP